MYQKSILKCIKKESKLGILDQVKIKRGSNTKNKLIKKGRLQHMSSISDEKMHRSLIDIVLQPSFWKCIGSLPALTTNEDKWGNAHI